MYRRREGKTKGRRKWGNKGGKECDKGEKEEDIEGRKFGFYVEVRKEGMEE